MKEKIWVRLQLNAVSVLRAKVRFVNAQREKLEEWGLLLSLYAHYTSASGCQRFCPNNEIKGVMRPFLFGKTETLALRKKKRLILYCFLKMG